VRCSATVVVVAHRDDEALWLSSVVASAGRVVFCFGAVERLPRCRWRISLTWRFPSLDNPTRKIDQDHGHEL
jgi:hypothetical protein